MLGDLAGQKRRVRHHRPRHLDLVWRESPRPTRIRAAFSRSGESRPRPFTQHFGFELGKRREDVEGGFSRWGRRIDGLAERSELDPTFAEHGNEIDEITELTESVELPCDDDVARTGEVDHK